jgi:CHAT domain-containing protein
MLTVADIGEGPTSRGQLMFLSACKTMTGGTTNLDEIITLATAMQYTGWQQVIATIWSVWATAAADVTDQFYPPIFAENRLQAQDAARSLHDAIRQLRAENPFRPSVWAPFVHVGI